MTQGSKNFLNRLQMVKEGGTSMNTLLKNYCTAPAKRGVRSLAVGLGVLLGMYLSLIHI